MTRDNIQLVMTYVIALLILVGSFVLIYQNVGDSGQAWLAVGAVLGYVFRDAGGSAGAHNAASVAAAGAPTIVDRRSPASSTDSIPATSATDAVG
jgi:hypothetical protein